MEPVIKHFAALTASGFNRGPTVEIANEKDAVQKALASHAIAFSTYDVTTVTLNGKEMKGEPENYSKRRYVGIDQLYTRDEVIALMKSDTTFGVQNHREMDEIFREAARSVIAHFETHPADAVYITGLERPGEFIQLKDGEKVFNRKGQQLWPAPPVPEDQKPKVTRPKGDRWKL